MGTWNSRGLRGSALEELINRTNEQYREKGLALIQKIPTPITPIKIERPLLRQMLRTACFTIYMCLSPLSFAF